MSTTLLVNHCLVFVVKERKEQEGKQNISLDQTKAPESFLMNELDSSLGVYLGQLS